MRFTHTLILGGLIIALALAALIFADRPSNPPVDRRHSIEANLLVPARIHEMLSRACYDCHSLETRWPWYSRLPIVSGLMRKDVTQGRAALNFSEWAKNGASGPARSSGLLQAACSEVEQHLMPKKPYYWLHPETHLRPDEIQALCAWTAEQSKHLQAAGGEQILFAAE